MLYNANIEQFVEFLCHLNVGLVSILPFHPQYTLSYITMIKWFFDENSVSVISLPILGVRILGTRS